MLGCIEAWDTTTKKRIWFRQIYVVFRDPSLEGDIQDIFISRMRLDQSKGSLEITNEKGGRFLLNLNTLDIKTVKGQAVIRR